jgi:hypothetical protein
MPTPSEQSNLRGALVRILRARGVPHADTAVQVIGVPQAHPVLFTVKAEERAALAVAQALASILIKMFYSRPAEWVLSKQEAETVIRATKFGARCRVETSMGGNCPQPSVGCCGPKKRIARLVCRSVRSYVHAFTPRDGAAPPGPPPRTKPRSEVA